MTINFPLNCFLPLLLLAGCSAGTASSSLQRSTQDLSLQERSRQTQWEIEVETIEDQAIAEVLGAPTEFVVTFSDDHHSWERAILFLERHTSKQAFQYISSPQEMIIVSNHGAVQDNYWYNVEKASHPEGWFYRVKAVSAGAGSHHLADRNARNLARFIRNGILERSLIAN